MLSRSQYFRSSHPICASRRENRRFQRDARIELLDRNVLEDPAYLTTPEKTRSLHTAPYNSSDAGLTATAAAAAAAHSDSAWHILFSALQQRVLSSEDGSSACYRLPYCSTAAAAVLALATVNESQRHNADDEGDEGSPRPKRTLCSRKRRDKEVFLGTASSWMQTDPLVRRAREQERTRRSSFQVTFACPTPAYQTPAERAQKQNKKTIRYKLYTVDPTAVVVASPRLRSHSR